MGEGQTVVYPFSMTWIKTIPREKAEGPLRDALEKQRALYPVEYATPSVPGLAPGGSIVESHSLIPDALHHAFSTFGALMSPDGCNVNPCPCENRGVQETWLGVVPRSNRWIAAERRNLHSPRREPWGSKCTAASRGAATSMWNRSTKRRCRRSAALPIRTNFPRLTPSAT